MRGSPQKFQPATHVLTGEPSLWAGGSGQRVEPPRPTTAPNSAFSTRPSRRRTPRLVPPAGPSAPPRPGSAHQLGRLAVTHFYKAQAAASYRRFGQSASPAPHRRAAQKAVCSVPAHQTPLRVSPPGASSSQDAPLHPDPISGGSSGRSGCVHPEQRVNDYNRARLCSATEYSVWLLTGLIR